MSAYWKQWKIGAWELCERVGIIRTCTTYSVKRTSVEIQIFAKCLLDLTDQIMTYVLLLFLVAMHCQLRSYKALFYRITACQSEYACKQ